MGDGVAGRSVSLVNVQHGSASFFSHSCFLCLLIDFGTVVTAIQMKGELFASGYQEHQVAVAFVLESAAAESQNVGSF